MKKLTDIYEKIIDWVEMVFHVMIIGVIGLQIFTRTFLDKPLKFPEEVSVFVMIAMVFVGLAVVEKYDGHLRVEFLQEMLPEGARKWFRVAGRALMLVVVAGILVGEFELFPQIKVLKTRAAGIPYAWLHGLIIVFTVLWGLFVVLGMIHELRKKV